MEAQRPTAPAQPPEQTSQSKRKQAKQGRMEAQAKPALLSGWVVVESRHSGRRNSRHGTTSPHVSSRCQPRRVFTPTASGGNQGTPENAARSFGHGKKRPDFSGSCDSRRPRGGLYQKGPLFIHKGSQSTALPVSAFRTRHNTPRSGFAASGPTKPLTRKRPLTRERAK